MTAFSEMTITGPLSAFGEVLVAQNVPIVQMSATYQNTNHVEFFTFGTAAAAEIASPFFTCSSGTDNGGFGSVGSKRQVSYKAGEGLSARFTTVFDAPVTDNTQQAGLFGNTDRLSVGYNESQVFGIFHYNHGASDIRELTISTGATSNNDATVRVGGTDHVIAITNSTSKVNAQEIAVFLNLNDTGLYDFWSNDNVVVCRSLQAATPAGTFNYTIGSTGSVASWATIQLGDTPTETFIAQTAWNRDTMTSLDPAKGNVWEFNLQYLGFGALDVYCESPVTGHFELCHRFEYANANILPSFANPTFRLSWVSQNSGGATAGTTVKGTSAAGFIQGKLHENDTPHSLHVRVVTAPASEASVVAFRNRGVFGTQRNRVEAYPKVLSLSNEGTKNCTFRVYKGATVDDPNDWIYVDKNESIMEYMLDNDTVSGGTLLDSVEIAKDSSLTVDISHLIHLLLPEETLLVTSDFASGNGDVEVSLAWQEDLP